MPSFIIYLSDINKSYIHLLEEYKLKSFSPIYETVKTVYIDIILPSKYACLFSNVWSIDKYGSDLITNMCCNNFWYEQYKFLYVCFNFSKEPEIPGSEHLIKFSLGWDHHRLNSNPFIKSKKWGKSKGTKMLQALEKIVYYILDSVQIHPEELLFLQNFL